MSTATPVRLQLSRRKGFDLQTASKAINGLPALRVDRSTGLGNPFPLTKGTSNPAAPDQKEVWAVGTWTGPAMWLVDTKEEARTISVKAFRQWLIAQPERLQRAVLTVRGHNLACWCRPGSLCHADVLLELGNPPACEEVTPR